VLLRVASGTNKQRAWEERAVFVPMSKDATQQFRLSDKYSGMLLYDEDGAVVSWVSFVWCSTCNGSSESQLGTEADGSPSGC